MGKLTEPQRVLLNDFASARGTCDDGYPPLKKLMALGYVQRVKLKYGDVFEITDAGRSALNPAADQNTEGEG